MSEINKNVINMLGYDIYFLWYKKTDLSNKIEK